MARPSPCSRSSGAAGASIGVVAGGLLIDLASWRWVFLVNVPIGLLTIPVARAPSSTSAPTHRAPPRPGREPGAGAAGPALPPGVPRLPNAVLFTMTLAGFCFQFLTALYLQDILGLDPMHTGLSYLP